MTLSSPEVVELDISVVPDVLGLRTCDSNAEVVRVLPGRARYSVCVLIPDDRVVSPGFHDVKLVHQTSESGPIVSMDDICDLMAAVALNSAFGYVSPANRVGDHEARLKNEVS